MQIHTHLHSGGLRAKIAQLHSRHCCRRQCIPTDPSLSKSTGTYCLRNGLLELCIYLLLLGAFLSSNAQKPLAVHCLAVLAWSGLSINNSKRIRISAEMLRGCLRFLRAGTRSKVMNPRPCAQSHYRILWTFSLLVCHSDRQKHRWVNKHFVNSFFKKRKNNNLPQYCIKNKNLLYLLTALTKGIDIKLCALWRINFLNYIVTNMSLQLTETIVGE